MVKGEITVFLSLVFLLLLTLVGALLESASIQLAKNERRADAGRAVESLFLYFLPRKRTVGLKYFLQTWLSREIRSSRPLPASAL